MHAVFDSFDLPIVRFLSGFAGKSPLLDHAINVLSRLDMFKGIALMCLFWYVWAEAPVNELPLVRELRQKRLTTVLIGTILIGGVSRGLQRVLSVHQRPLLSNLGLPFPVTDFDAGSLNAWNSFPSDHAMFFFALGAGIWTVDRRAGLIAFAWTLVVIDFPRVYLGIHFPSDVVFGAVFGIIGMALFLALPLARFERWLSGWRSAHQGLFMAALFFTTYTIGQLLGDLRELAQSLSRVLLHHG